LVFLFLVLFLFKLSTKIQKVWLNNKNIERKILFLELFSVISQSETENNN